MTKVIWINRLGKRMVHTMGAKVSLSYARNWFRENILECQGILSIDEQRNSQLRLVSIENYE